MEDAGSLYSEKILQGETLIECCIVKGQSLFFMSICKLNTA